MSDVPAVTVLMPVFNGARHLRSTLESLQKQTFPDFEVLLVDDGSTDDSVSIAQSLGDPRIRILANAKNLGLVESLNRGLTDARGIFIARLDADDLCRQDRLAQQIQFLRGNPAVPLIGSDARLIDANGRWCGRWRTGGSADLVRWDCGFRTPFAHSSAMFRRDVILNRFGGYRNCRACEDLDLWGRVASGFPVVTQPVCLISYRQHQASVMAGEHASTGEDRSIAIRKILKSNLYALAPGTPEPCLDVIAMAWSQSEPDVHWDAYFAAVDAVRLAFLRGHRTLRGFMRLQADQNYMLFNRLPSSKRVLFLKELYRADRHVFLRLPWIRVAIMMLRG